MATRTRTLSAKDQETIAFWMPKPCDYCQSQNVKLRRVIISSGIDQYRWYCDDCTRIARKQGQNIPSWIVQYWYESGKLPIPPSELPLAGDYTAQAVCCVCGKPGAELHHFAPESLGDYFGGEWVQWPTAYLCKYHHDLWHSVVTPWMPHVKNNPIAQDVLRKYYEAVGV